MAALRFRPGCHLPPPDASLEESRVARRKERDECANLGSAAGGRSDRKQVVRLKRLDGAETADVDLTQPTACSNDGQEDPNVRPVSKFALHFSRTAQRQSGYQSAGPPATLMSRDGLQKEASGMTVAITASSDRFRHRLPLLRRLVSGVSCARADGNAEDARDRALRSRTCWKISPRL